MKKWAGILLVALSGLLLGAYLQHRPGYGDDFSVSISTRAGTTSWSRSCCLTIRGGRWGADRLLLESSSWGAYHH
ncbi:hypothetical protein [Alkalilimnicola ehrlichii]|uniref:hypothetical protein n=1 Tax=Alkalilimnicola ehrlichii TaxID=351052 RepID=UPI0015F284DD|nr:hypothetical protein [Alkalilimnicola ehrlichii]